MIETVCWYCRHAVFFVFARFLFPNICLFASFPLTLPPWNELLFIYCSDGWQGKWLLPSKLVCRSCHLCSVVMCWNRGRNRGEERFCNPRVFILNNQRKNFSRRLSSSWHMPMPIFCAVKDVGCMLGGVTCISPHFLCHDWQSCLLFRRCFVLRLIWARSVRWILPLCR